MGLFSSDKKKNLNKGLEKTKTSLGETDLHFYNETEQEREERKQQERELLK